MRRAARRFAFSPVVVAIGETFPQTWTIGYSVRKIRRSYLGSCLRVRRSSDNAEQDIGFTAGSPDDVLDAVALLAFVGVGNGFVTKWYDQGLNAHDLLQATSGAQPRIVSSGVIDLMGTAPALVFDGSDDYMQAADHADQSFGSAPWSIEMRVQITSFGVGGGTWYEARTGSGTFNVIYYYTDSNFYYNTSVGVNSTLATSVFSLGTPYHLAVNRGAGDIVYPFVDGVLKTTTTDSTVLNGDRLRFGINYLGASPFEGKCNELLLNKGICNDTTSYTPYAAPT